MKIRNNLSQIGCSRTFKNILRNENDDNNINRDIVAHVGEINKNKFASRLNVKSTDNLIVSDSETKKMKMKYERNYLSSNSALRVTIGLPDKQRKSISAFRRDQIESNKSDSKQFSPTKGKNLKLIEDLFHKNPMETLNKQKIKENIIENQTRNKVKCGRVADYLGSSGVKSIFNTYNGSSKAFNDKITNKEGFLANKNSQDDKKHEFKRFNHYFEGKKGCFMK